MKSLIFCTKKPIDYRKIIDLIKIEYKSCKGNDKVVSFGKTPKNLFIWLPSTDINDNDTKIDMEEDLPYIPFENPYFTSVEFHIADIAKKVVTILLNEYPELFVLYEDYRVSANDFLQLEISSKRNKKIL